MNTKFTALTLAAATAFAFAPKPAVASDKGLAVVGGLIGGIIIASAINDHCDTRTIIVNDRCDAPRVYAPVRYEDGYWKTVEVRAWVPGYWVSERDYNGRCYRRYVEGRYECRTDRVWVSYNRYDRHDDRRDDRYDRRDDRHGRDIGRGYGRDYDRHDHDYRR
jgi:hypothetical protein